MYENHLWKLIKKYPEKNWDWDSISRNSNTTWDLIKNNLSKYPWDWGSISCNPNITWDIIENNLSKYPWTWNGISCNPNITADIIRKTINKYDWDISVLSECKFLTWDIVESNPDKKWNWTNIMESNDELFWIKLQTIKSYKELGIEAWMFYECASRNSYITWSYVLDNIEEYWDSDCILSYKPKTWKEIEDYLEPKDWEYRYPRDSHRHNNTILVLRSEILWNGISSNDYAFTWEFVESHPEYGWTWEEMSNLSIITWDIVKNNPDKTWNWDLLSSNENMTIDIIRENLSYPWNWCYVSANPNITWKIVKNNMDLPWDWDTLIDNIEMPVSFIKKNINLFDCESISSSWIWMNLPISIIEDNIDKTWDWYNISQIPNITFDFVDKNIDKDWDFKKLSKNEYCNNLRLCLVRDRNTYRDSLKQYRNRVLPDDVIDLLCKYYSHKYYD